MVLRCKTPIFHIFEKTKIGKNFKKILKKIENTSLTLIINKNSQ